MSSLKHSWILLAAAALAACASTPAEPPVESYTFGDKHCIRETGTRLKRPEGSCVASPGRVISKHDLEHAGGVDLNEKMSTLVPF